MRLDSVRELKASTKELFVTQGMARGVGMSVDLPEIGAHARAYDLALDMPARRLARSRSVPLFALGVSASRKGADGYHLAVRIQHRILQNSPALDEVVRRAHGEVDVRYVGPVIKRNVPWSRQVHRPLVIGASIAHFAVTAGSVGAFVRKKRGGATYLLSNNHVLADENRGEAGDAIVQPGSADGGYRRTFHRRGTRQIHTAAGSRRQQPGRRCVGEGAE